jgi:aspartate/methionine/tyrosine aminotransferase
VKHPPSSVRSAPSPSALVSAAEEALSVKVNNAVYDLRRSGAEVIVLSLGEAFFELPAFSPAGLSAASNHYSHSRGLPELRSRLAAYYRDDFGVEIDPESEILITAGSKAAIFFALLATIDPGDEVVMQEPVWVSYPEQVRLSRGEPVQIPYDAPLASFESHIAPRTKALIVNNPSNPPGRVYSEREVGYLVDLARANGLYLLSDEAYSDFVLDETFPSAGRFDSAKHNVIVCNSVSKSLGISGWRIGYVIAKAELIKEILKLNQHVVTCPPTPLAEYVATNFDAMRAAARPQIEAVLRKRSEVMNYLDSKGLSYLPGRSTFYLFVSIAPTTLGSTSFCSRLLDEYRVAAVPGIGYGASCDGFVRISVGTESLDSILAGIDRLHRLIEQTSRNPAAG